MDSNKCSAQVERFEVVETGWRRRWTDDEKKIVLESLETPRSVSSTARRYGISRSLLLTWRRSFGAGRAVKKNPGPLCAGDGDAGPVASAIDSFSDGSERTHGDCRRQGLSRDCRCRRRYDRFVSRIGSAGAAMIPIAAGASIGIATGRTDMRKGMQGLAWLVQEGLARDPFLCVGRDYVAEAPLTQANADHAWIPPPHNNQMLASSCRMVSFGRKRALRSPEPPTFSSPRRIISTSAAAYRWVVAT